LNGGGDEKSRDKRAIKSGAHRPEGGGEKRKQRTESEKGKGQAAQKHGLSRNLKTI